MLLLSSKPHSCFASDFSASFEFAQTQGKVDTKETSTTEEATLDFSTTSLEVGVDFFHRPALAYYAQVILPLQSDIDANMTGLDLGARFYVGSLGRKTKVKIDDVQISSLPTQGAFFFGGFSSRNLSLSDRTLNFLGGELGLGYDHHFSSRLALRAGVTGQYLKNASTRTMSAGSFSLGLLYQF